MPSRLKSRGLSLTVGSHVGFYPVFYLELVEEFGFPIYDKNTDCTNNLIFIFFYYLL
jgi:hypothetical protein